MSGDEENKLRFDVRNRLAAHLLYETRTVIEDLFQTVPVRWGGIEQEQSVEKLGLPVLPQESRDIVYQELHRISVRVMNPESVFSNEEIDGRIIDEAAREKT